MAPSYESRMAGSQPREQNMYTVHTVYDAEAAAAATNTCLLTTVLLAPPRFASTERESSRISETGYFQAE